MKLSFSERDEHGNGHGVDILLLPTATPKQIVEIGKFYEKVGWQPNRLTRRTLDAARAKVKLARSKNRRARNANR